MNTLFGGGNKGHLGVLMPSGPYLTQAGEDWIVPNPGLNLAPINDQATEKDTKKKETRLLIMCEEDIKIAKTVITLTLKKVLPEAFPEEYHIELGELILGYDRVTPKEIIVHILRH